MKEITDDELNKYLVGTLPEGVTLYAIFDCCHSGTIVDLHYVWDEDKRKFVRDSHHAMTRANVFMISGCMNVQTSADLPPGRFSHGSLLVNHYFFIVLFFCFVCSCFVCCLRIFYQTLIRSFFSFAFFSGYAAGVTQAVGALTNSLLKVGVITFGVVYQYLPVIKH
jgi:hypothetical protein